MASPYKSNTAKGILQNRTEITVRRMSGGVFDSEEVPEYKKQKPEINRKIALN